jgi:hypothetical protein
VGGGLLHTERITLNAAGFRGAGILPAVFVPAEVVEKRRLEADATTSICSLKAES